MTASFQRLARSLFGVDQQESREALAEDEEERLAKRAEKGIPASAGRALVVTQQRLHRIKLLTQPVQADLIDCGTDVDE